MVLSVLIITHIPNLPTPACCVCRELWRQAGPGQKIAAAAARASGSWSLRASCGLRLARGSRRRSGKPGEPQGKAASCKAPPGAEAELVADEEEDECVICCDRLEARASFNILCVCVPCKGCPCVRTKRTSAVSAERRWRHVPAWLFSPQALCCFPLQIQNRL